MYDWVGCRIAVHELGYVGLPLVASFSKHFETIGSDLSLQRASELKQHIEIIEDASELALNMGFYVSYSLERISDGSEPIAQYGFVERTHQRHPSRSCKIAGPW